MLHILLLILKIIGIILAVILGILVLLVLIVVFVPVRYEVNGRCGAGLLTLKVKGRVTWLFSLVRADIYYKENKLKWRLRIAWKKMLGGQEYGSGESDGKTDAGAQNTETEGEEYEEIWKETDDEKSSEKAWRAEAEEGEESDEEVWKKGFGEGCKAEESDEKAWYESVEDEEDSTKHQKELGENGKSRQKISEEFEEAYSDDEEGVFSGREGNEEQDDEDSGRLQRLVEKIKGICCKIKCTIRNICDKIKKLLEKKDKLSRFLRDETHVKAFKKAKKEVFRLLRRLRPKKFLLQAEFGFDDPSWTGRALAAVAPFYPYFEECVSLKPDFTGKALKGKLYVKGRIRFCHFAVLAWKLFFSRNVRRTYKDIKNFKF